ncbi:MAG TPA: hypothetical protein VEG38_04720 [Acidimicrobiia bacterium]|nr:hypothetical protein [Acidimicrobiia bacterium]
MLDDSFKIVADVGFENPFAAEEKWAPFNVQAIGSSVFVAYAELGEPGEEEPGTGKGRLAEFTVDGALTTPGTAATT